MKIHMILDVQRDDTPGRSLFDEVAPELESELERLQFEVGDGRSQAVYSVRVLGVGQTAQKAADSAKIRGN